MVVNRIGYPCAIQVYAREVTLSSALRRRTDQSTANTIRAAGFVESMSRCGLNPGSKDTERRLFRCEGLAPKRVTIALWA